MTLLAHLVDALVRLRHRFGHCSHWMVEMSDGPVCLLCGQAWIWRRRQGWCD